MVGLGLGKRKGSCFRLFIRALARKRQPQGQGFVGLGIPVINAGDQPMTIAAQYQGLGAQLRGTRNAVAQAPHRYLQAHDPLEQHQVLGRRTARFLQPGKRMLAIFERFGDVRGKQRELGIAINCLLHLLPRP